MSPYLPWWLTALALGSITVGYWIAIRRPLGVSGVLARFTRVREELEFDRGVAAVNDADQSALEAELLAMTREAFGTAGGPAGDAASSTSGEPTSGAGAMEPAAHAAEAGRACAPVPRLGAHLTFLVMLVVGGALAALLRGAWAPGTGLGEGFARHIAAGPAGLAALAGGGALVGFGTATCGGCSAGHGLTGSGRLMPGSLVSTLVFFVAAVAVALALGWRLS
jgi:uncharacterized protein